MPDTVQDLIRKAAAEAGIPASLALAVAEQESGFNPTAMGPEITAGRAKGQRAIGTFQIIPSTADMLGIDAHDPRQNIIGGTKYLRQLMDKHEGNLDLVLSEYGGDVTKGTYAPGVRKRLAKYQTEQVGQPTPQPPTVVGGAAGVPPVAPAPTPGAIPVSAAASPSAVGAPAAPLSSPLGERARQQQLTRTDLPADVRAQLGALGLTGEANRDVILQNLAAIDPRTSSGRENLAGAAGAIGMGIATEGLSTVAGVLPWVARIVGPTLGAAVTGGAEAGVEGQSVPEAALRQGAYEAGGTALLWPLKRFAKGIVGSRVARQAEEGLDATVRAARRRLTEGVAAAKDMASAAIQATSELGQRAKQATRMQTRATTTAARNAARDLVADTELQNAASIADVTKTYDNLLAQPPSSITAGQLTKEAVEGPAKKALDLAGQRVSEAAKTGPMIQMTPIQNALDAMAKSARPDSIFASGSVTDAIGFLKNVSAGRGAAAAETAGLRDPSRLNAIIAEQLGLPENHPLPGLLGQIQRAPESISFADAHKLKMLLDEGVNWDRTAKKHLEKITKGLRSTLREALAVHEPYNVATGAYQAMVPLYRKGVGKRVITAAQSNPDAIARTLSVKNPSQALALRDLLLTQSAAGGDAEAGQRAWDAVRASFVYDKVLRGGVKDLSTRVRALVEQNPEFARAVLNDEPSQRIVSNLDRLGHAYTQAVEQAVQSSVAAKAAGTGMKDAAATSALSARETTRQAAQQAVAKARSEGAKGIASVRTSARAGIDAAQQAQTRLRESSLHENTLGGQAANVIRAVTLGPKSIWGALSLVRLLDGPTSKDLLEWAAYSDANTQRLVGILTGQVPDRVAASTIREIVHSLSSPTKPTTPTTSTTPTAPTAAPALTAP